MSLEIGLTVLSKRRHRLRIDAHMNYVGGNPKLVRVVLEFCIQTSAISICVSVLEINAS